MPKYAQKTEIIPDLLVHGENISASNYSDMIARRSEKFVSLVFCTIYCKFVAPKTVCYYLFI